MKSSKLLAFLLLPVTCTMMFITGTVVTAAYIYVAVSIFVIYSISVHGKHHLYEPNSKRLLKGPVFFLGNHVTYKDWGFIIALLFWSLVFRRRRIVFVMWYQFYDIPILKHFLNAAGAIPISGKDKPKIYHRAFEHMQEAIEQGKFLVLFPEGALTKNGAIQPFKGGFMKLLKHAQQQNIAIKVVPFALVGLWDSIYSKQKGALFSRRWFKNLKIRMRFKVHLVFAKPLERDEVTSPEQIQAIVTRLFNDPDGTANNGVSPVTV